jgi:hypothetical protein
MTPVKIGRALPDLLSIVMHAGVLGVPPSEFLGAIARGS